jgi:hypothetical protein
MLNILFSFFLRFSNGRLGSEVTVEDFPLCKLLYSRMVLRVGGKATTSSYLKRGVRLWI